jgi:hypothetical protein
MDGDNNGIGGSLGWWILDSSPMRYLELIAGSRASTPHAYIVPLVVIAPYGIPPGLTLARGKRTKSYELFSNRFFDVNPWLTKVVE